AYRTALKARTRATHRRARELPLADEPLAPAAPEPVADWRPLLDQALDRLPERFRSAVVLCDLGGRSRKEAARHLGLAEGTLSSRLARGRALLARRLARFAP